MSVSEDAGLSIDTSVTSDAPASEPIGAVGLTTGRDAAGRFAAGNSAALVTGASSPAFWANVDGARREIAAAVVSDAGFAEIDAPRALQLAADGLAQAALMRDAAFARVVEAGGPMTTAGRTRRAFVVWQAATDRLERHLRLVGLRRVPRAAQSLDDLLSDKPTTTDDKE